MKKINIANILKDCPEGIKLYSPLCGECTFDYINFGTIICRRPNGQDITFTSEGYFMIPSNDDCECMIFPSKENRDWSTFKQPKFKNGDVIVSACGNIALFSHTAKSDYLKDKNTVYYHCMLPAYSLFSNSSIKIKIDCGIGYDEDCTLATAAQNKKLFKAIKEAGYYWDSKEGVLKPTLKAILKTFKKGDCIKVTFPEGNYAVAIVDSIKNDTQYMYYKTKKDRDNAFETISCKLINEN